MSALAGFASHTPFSQTIAAFVLHALWQAPLLAGAAALAIRIGRPQARVAHMVWAATLLLCVLMPFAATIVARRAAMSDAQRTGDATVTFVAADYAGHLPELQRMPLWQRLLDRHFNRRYGVTPFAFTLPVRIARVVASVYGLIALCLALRLLVGWRRSLRLVAAAAELAPESAMATALLRQCSSLELDLPPVRMSDDIAGPALAGAFRPTLLLPSCVAAMSSTEIEAVLAHELAHLRRHDPPLHLVCSLLLVPVGFHPAALWVAQRVRQTREMACDAEAAAQMGSAARYAHALLQVAERTGMGDVGTAGVDLFQSGLGLFETGLGLFSNSHERTGGAMEERMRTMMTVDTSISAAARAARWSACVLVGGVALLAAAMVQVQPALAQQQQPSAVAEPVTEQASPNPVVTLTQDNQPQLLGAEHAQEQLRKARRDLDAAAATATTDDERTKIATARAVIGAAQERLADAGGQRMHLSVDALKLDPQVRLQMDALKDFKLDPQVRIMIENLKLDPKIKVQIEKQKVDAEKIRVEVEKHRADFDRIRVETQTPEFQAKIKAQVAEARKQMAEVTIDGAQMQRLLKDAEQQRMNAVAMMRSGEMQRQIAEANSMVARVEMPDAATAPNSGVMHVPDAPAASQDKRIKIEGRVMAGNVLNKTLPVYPQEAKDAKISGAVVLHALIDETGKVESLQIISSPDKSLSISAEDAVRQWTYRPYLLNGNPMAVETTITVNYSFGG